jgi:hypothetical protein
MAVPTEIRQRAIALLENLPGASLVRAVKFLESLSHELVEESALLEIIQCRLSSEEKDRLAYLRQQNEREVITDTEHQELLIYIDRIEQQDADRAEASIKLAQLRQVDLKVLINE